MRVVFLLSDYVLHNSIVARYAEARPEDVVSVVKIPLVLKGKGRRQTASRIVPQLSRRFVLGKLFEFLSLGALTHLPKLLRRGAHFRRLRRTASKLGLAFLRTENVMSEECLRFVRDARPDVVVTLFHQIVKEPLISIPRLGVVNVHPGLLPEFRGIQPYFWELCEGSREGGVTLHTIDDESIDTGRVLARAAFRVQPGMSVQLCYWLTSRLAAELLPDCLARFESGALTPVPQPDGGAYYRWPDSAAVDRLHERGHVLISLRDLWGMLTGKYDEAPGGL